MIHPGNLPSAIYVIKLFISFQIMMSYCKERRLLRRSKNKGNSVLLAFIALASSSPRHSPNKVVATQTCQNLAQEFDGNEARMALIHDVNRQVLVAEKKFRDSINDAESRLAVSKTLDQIVADDQKYLSAGDRITTLIIANKCTPPDHVTSWYTYSDTNPNRKTPTP
jgi:hypothetical protein